MRASLSLIAVLVAGCGGPAATAVPTATVYTLTGTMTLKAADSGGPRSDCHGTGGFDDITGGLDVVVRDQANTILATSRLAPGTADIAAATCVLPFAVPGVPTATFYSIEVGRRGALTYSFADMVGKNWTVAFTLGTQ